MIHRTAATASTTPIHTMMIHVIHRAVQDVMIAEEAGLIDKDLQLNEKRYRHMLSTGRHTLKATSADRLELVDCTTLPSFFDPQQLQPLLDECGLDLDAARIRREMRDKILKQKETKVC